MTYARVRPISALILAATLLVAPLAFAAPADESGQVSWTAPLRAAFRAVEALLGEVDPPGSQVASAPAGSQQTDAGGDMDPNG